MFEGISDAIDEVAADPSVRGRRAARRGQELLLRPGHHELRRRGPDRSRTCSRRRDGEAANLAQRVAYGWQTLPAPVIAAVHGNCIGGGAQIALGADVRIIAPGSRLDPREPLGPDPGHGAHRSLPRLVRFDVAKELVLTARILDAEEASGSASRPGSTTIRWRRPGAGGRDRRAVARRDPARQGAARAGLEPARRASRWHSRRSCRASCSARRISSRRWAPG